MYLSNSEISDIVIIAYVFTLSRHRILHLLTSIFRDIRARTPRILYLLIFAALKRQKLFLSLKF